MLSGVSWCQILEEPIPEYCHPEQHADYAGIGLSWGLDHKTASAAQCVVCYVPALTVVAAAHGSCSVTPAARCRWQGRNSLLHMGDRRRPCCAYINTITILSSAGRRCCAACKAKAAEGCNVWVWCGDPSGLCWTPDVWCARSPLGSYHGRAQDAFVVLLNCGCASQAAGHTGDSLWSCSHHCCPCVLGADQQSNQDAKPLSVSLTTQEPQHGSLLAEEAGGVGWQHGPGGHKPEGQCARRLHREVQEGAPERTADSAMGFRPCEGNLKC